MDKITKYDNLIDFTLKSVLNTQYDVYLLDSEEYKKFHRNHRAYTFLSKIFLEEFMVLFSNFIDDACFFDKFQKNVQELNSSDIDEYGKEGTLSEITSDDPEKASVACCVTLEEKINPVLFLLPFLSFDIIENNISSFSNICEMGKDLMFVILLREDLIRDEQQTMFNISHESFHIFESLKGQSYKNEEINEISVEIIECYNEIDKFFHFDDSYLRSLLRSN